MNKTAFIFPGQGSQWCGMALGLLESSPVFAESMYDRNTKGRGVGGKIVVTE